mgnify:CR=1 FL=1
MAVKYKVIGSKNPQSKDENAILFYPKLCDSVQLNTSRVSKIMAMRSSVSKSDIYNVLIGLAELIPELLGEGHTIKLDGFGIFRLHAKTKTMNDPAKVNVKNITGYRLSFLPDKEMKRELQLIEAEKARG